MRRVGRVLVFLALALPSYALEDEPGHVTTGETKSTAAQLLDDRRATASFVENRGQWRDAIQYAASTRHYRAWMSSNGGLFLQFRSPDSKRSAVLELAFGEGSDCAQVTGLEVQSGRVNFFRGQPSSWITHVPTFGALLLAPTWSSPRSYWHFPMQSL